MIGKGKTVVRGKKGRGKGGGKRQWGPTKIGNVVVPLEKELKIQKWKAAP